MSWPNSAHPKNSRGHPRAADVWLPLRLAHPFSYRVDPEQPVNAGDHVRVSFRGREEVGVAWRVRPIGEEEAARLKPIAEVLDFPPMPEARRAFIEWMADYYVSSPGLVLKLFLATRQALRKPRAARGWQARLSPAEARARGLRLTAQRARVLALAHDAPPMTTRELAAAAGVGESVVRRLADDGWLTSVALPAEREEWPEEAVTRHAPDLSAEQRAAADVLAGMARRARFDVALLDGITGAGKTEVYFEAMSAVLDQGRQALLLLPEIALTSGFLERVRARFGITPAEWHSDMPPAARRRVFRAVAAGRARIVVAARSGLFLPWRDLGLIVVDEEHEPAYKQEGGVPYHGRDAAVMMGRLSDFPVILSSATPSLESLVNAERGRYRHVRLRERFGAAVLPEITLVDLRREHLEPRRWISAPLAAAVEETLSRGEQAMLFLNRRGYAPLTLCRACGHRLQCPHCSAWLVWHHAPPASTRQLASAQGVLLCHHCGHAMPPPAACPACGAEKRMAAVGPGVERLAEEAAARWEQARVATLSSDLWQGAALKRLMRAIAAGEHDIIIGTQLIAKGHHFPLLTLVGVIDADLSLETADPRASERTWQLLAQVAGRAGRATRKGRALIQTWMPDNPLLRALAAGDREAFMARERRARELAGMPPFGRLAALVVSGRPGEVAPFCRELARRLPPSRVVQALGPAPAPLEKLRGRQRWRFLLKGPRNADLQGYLRAWLRDVKVPAGMRLEIDVDPHNFM